MCSTHYKIQACLYVTTYVSTVIRNRNLVIDKSVGVGTLDRAANFFFSVIICFWRHDLVK